ncbi:MAG: NAD-dependent malic enzyme [Flavobacteriales bacterium]|nr:NAD-dependent malic enzyme [Flavobacteriales bacterium]
MAKMGIKLMKDKRKNKSTAFTREERDELGLRGLLPYAVSTQQMQVQRILTNLRRLDDDLDRYMALNALMHRNDRLFYRVIMENIEELLPIIYTPTVGEACRRFSHIFSLPKGFYITPEDKGRISEMLENWNHRNIDVIVITDGERILGLGDLGANGMGIPIGKLSLYTAFGGIDPNKTLPVMFDIGTDNEAIRNEMLYLGYPYPRLRGEAYLELMDEFVHAVKKRFPGVLLQFEDFLTPYAYALLNRYKHQILCFNDDIQGTAAVALAGIYGSTHITGKAFKDFKILFLGAGSAATGIADLTHSAFIKEGLSVRDAYSRLSFCDKDGLLTRDREDLMDHNRPYVLDSESMDFIQAIEAIQPDILIGATGAGGTFTQEVIEKMCEVNERPVIFALSNPTSRAECTAEQAYRWSDGQAIFVSGSPFGPVEHKGKVYRPGQGNNAYIFPGLGLGLIASKAQRVEDEMLIAAARALADQLESTDLEQGSLYPPLNRIREVSHVIASRVAQTVYDMGLTTKRRPRNLEERIEKMMYDPEY